MKIQIKGNYSKQDRKRIVTVIQAIIECTTVKEIFINQDCLNDKLYSVNTTTQKGTFRMCFRKE